MVESSTMQLGLISVNAGDFDSAEQYYQRIEKLIDDSKRSIILDIYY